MVEDSFTIKQLLIMNIYKKRRMPLMLSIFAFTMILLISGCSKRINFPPSAVVPGVEPRAKVKKTDDGDYRVTLDVNHLVRPEQLSPPKKHYVVWINTVNEGVKNIGELKNRSGMLANTRRANFERTVNQKPTQIFVTAENSTDMKFAGDHTVFRSETFRVK